MTVQKFKRLRLALLSILAIVFVITLTFGLVACSKSDSDSDGLHSYDYKTNTRVLYSAVTKGTVNRYKPVAGIKDERKAFDTDLFNFDESKRYPTYGSTLSYVIGTSPDKVAARNAIISESAYLCAWGTAGANNGGTQTADKYTKIDKDGYLWQYKNNEWIHSLNWGTTAYTESNYRRLYQHTASVGLYLGDIDDKEKAVVKEITMRKRDYLTGYGITGLYAPAGEVIKVQISGADMTATGGISIHIGQALYNGQANNIWSEKNQMQRFPYLLTTLNLTASTCEYDEATDTWTGYIGSFIGGPIYIRNESATFTTTISGGIPYSHFILGYTTEQEFKECSKTSVPYFDLEVWDNGVLHSGPKRYAASFSYNDLYQAAVLWDKVASVTTSPNKSYGIVFLYDPFVAAGAAVAFPGRNSVNCPLGWMSSSLNYNAIVTSGSWGNFHEYHHNFQGYGFGSGADGEVTNNGLNLVSYSLFTNISAARQLSGFGGAGLSGWNCYTSAPWALNQVNAGSITSTNGLAIYATLLHNFGQDQYTKARTANGVNNYLNTWATNTHYDFTYFANMVSAYGGGTYTPSDAVKNANYPLFVPVSSVYQTGRTYYYDGERREINTMQPYVIPYGKSFTVDLNPYTVNAASQYESGSVVIGKGFTYKIKSVNADGANGKFVETNQKGIYTFTPDKQLNSGKIYVTLEITTTDGAKVWNGHALQDVDLILEFQQSHETNKNVLERTTYFYTEATAYTDARTAFEKGYAGYTSKNDRDHSNPTQNCNTDIWYCTESSINNFPNANPELDIVTPYSIDEVRGKLYFPEAGKYNIYLRGRKNCAVYYSTDGGNNYTLGTYIADDSTAYQWRTDKYFTLELKAESWVYFKEILINVQISSGMAGFIGLGIGQWTVPLYTTKEVDGVTKYYDGNGNEVSAEQASKVDPVAPTTISYATAYRQSYEFKKEFESDYFYVRSYSYDYIDNISAPKDQVTVTETNYTATGWGSGMPIENITDGKNNTYIHTSWQVTASNPLKLTFDLGNTKTINRISFYCRNNNGMLETPKTFTVEGSLDGEEWFTVSEYDNAPRSGNTVTVDFEDTTLRYCRIIISATHQGNGNYYIVIGEITFTHATEVLGGKQLAPDDAKIAYKGNWRVAQANSSFGHVYVGEKKATVSFEFEGTRLGILSSSQFGHNFEVKIDGKNVNSIALKEDDFAEYFSFLSEELSKGKHTVTITCKGVASIDSFVIYP